MVMAVLLAGVFETLAQDTAYEPLPTLRAADFISATDLKGPNHSVVPEARNDGLLNRYKLRTTWGEYDVHGTVMALIRIHEINAIRKLMEMGTSEEVGNEVVGETGEKLKTVGKVITDPVTTIGNLPKGASKFFGSLGESMRGTKSDYEGSMLDSVLGISEAERELAVSLRVDPYTTNPVLRKELNRVAKARGLTGGALNLGLGIVTGGVASVVVTGVNVSQTLLEQLVTQSPPQLRILNRKKLMEAGVSKRDADRFTSRQALSPTHQTIIADVLCSIKGVKGIHNFLALAERVASQSDALFLQRSARLMLHYHRKMVPLVEIRRYGAAPACLDKEGRLVVALPMDYAVWTETAAARVAQLDGVRASDPTVKGLGLYTDGKSSEEFQKNLAAKGFVIEAAQLGRELPTE